MSYSADRRNAMSAAIFGLWRNWAVAVGLLMVLASSVPLVPRQWLAPMNLLFFIALQVMHSELRRRDFPTCSRLLREVSTVLIVTGLTIVALIFIHKHGGYYEVNGQPILKDTPFIGILITAPLTTIVAAIYLLRRTEPEVCRRCKARYGNVIEHGFIGNLFGREWRYQTGLLLTLSALLTVIDWGYYLIHYINVSFNRADSFFFVWMPMALYVLSLIYLGIRYYYLWMHYCLGDDALIAKRSAQTTLRFIVIYKDCIFVGFGHTKRRFDNGAVVKRFDTPAVYTESYHERENLSSAISIFERETGIKGATIRFAYSSPDTVTFRNIFHYLVFLPHLDSIVDSKLQGEWFTWGQLRMMANQKILSRDLVTELRRIYKVAMAWKTYDRQGLRRYNIKHYRPTFRIRDIKSWDVDYNDYHWLTVADNNQDSFWYPLRRLFNRVPAQRTT